MACFLGINLGTSGVKVVVVDEIGRVSLQDWHRGLLITVTDHPVIKPDKVLHTIPTPFLKNGFLWG